MLIGIDASRANRKHKGGPEWYSYYLIRWLAKLDQKNQYVLYSYRPLTGGLVDLTTAQHIGPDDNNKEAVFDDKGFQILKSPYNNFKAKILNWPFHFFWTQACLSCEILLHKPDILFVPAHSLPVIHPKKSLVTMHDIAFEREKWLYSHDYIGPDSAFKRKVINYFVKLFTFGKYEANIIGYHRWSSKFAVKHAAKIITISDFSKKEIMEVYNAPDDKVKVILNGYNRGLYKKIENQDDIAPVLNKYGIEKPYILYVSKLEKKKNTPALVEAFAIMREQHKQIKHKLVLAGDAGLGYDEIKYIIREYNLDDEVIATGWVPELDMPYIYNGASAFIFPSLYEGFGIPLLQAMACGVPIAASQTTSIPEVVGQAAVFFNPKDVKSIAEAMAEIITNEKLKNELIAKGFDRVKKFSWQKCAEETLAVINSLM